MGSIARRRASTWRNIVHNRHCWFFYAQVKHACNPRNPGEDAIDAMLLKLAGAMARELARAMALEMALEHSGAVP
jgi:predicted component of type VI protein secretion system